ncbi:MAG: hypothetical protein ACOCSQ_02125 [Planctomycetota bacterium]
MDEELDNVNGESRWASVRIYGIGVGLASASALYGLIALLLGRAFLPGLSANGLTVGGSSGRALAASYLVGGIYLFLRLYLGPRLKSSPWYSLLYGVQCLLLAGLIALLIYMLMHMGEVM